MTDDELLEWLGFQAEGANTDEDSRKFSAVIDRVLGRQIETRAVVRPAPTSAAHWPMLSGSYALSEIDFESVTSLMAPLCATARPM